MILISSFAAPASAADVIYDYDDFITEYDFYPAGISDAFPNGYCLVSVTLPLDAFTIFVTKGSSVMISSAGSSTPSKLTYKFSGNTAYQVYFSSPKLSATDIPSGTIFDLYLDISYNGFSWDSLSSPSAVLNIHYLNSEGVDLKQQYIPNNSWDDPNGGECIVTGTLNKPVGADHMQFSTILRGFNIPGSTSSTYEVTFRMLTCTLMMTLDSLVFQQNQTGKTNKILASVEKQLEAQNKTLEDLLQGTPEQNQAADEAVGTLQGSGNKLNDLNDSLNSVEKPDVSEFDVSIDSLIPSTSLTALTTPILAFWENDTLKAMLVIVLTLVLVSWVFFGKKG